MDRSGRVVVTGLGCVSPLGGDVRSTWDALLQGHTRRAPLQVINVEGCRVTEGAEACLPPLDWMPAKAAARLSRASRLALPAAREALRGAGLISADGRLVFPRLEMALSTTACGMEFGEGFLRGAAARSRKGQAVRVAGYPAHQQASDLQRHLGFCGPAMIVSNACASGANAIGHAFDLVRSGMADVVLAGGFEALCELVFCGFDCLQALAPDACKPFGVDRRGLMLGEGAAFLVIESAAHAARRGAEPLAAIAGYGHSTDSFHITQPDPTGAPLERAIRDALAVAEADSSEIAHVNAHGTGTPFNDAAESAAFCRIFPDAGNGPRICSTKAAIGHTLGAAGCIEALFAAMSLRTGCIPPQANAENPVPEMRGRLPGMGETLRGNAVLSVNLGFGGSNAALVFCKP
jgi:3-oxoacyl-[acyl-carrier-protein] synthase II